LRFRGSTVVGWVACCDSASLWLGENFELISFLTLLLHVCVDHDDGLHLARHQERDIFILNHLAPFCPKVELRLEARLQSPLTPTPFVIVMVGSVALEYRTHISWSSPCTAVYPSCLLVVITSWKFLQADILMPLLPLLLNAWTWETFSSYA
jgi:hypothetical protein